MPICGGSPSWPSRGWRRHHAGAGRAATDACHHRQVSRTRSHRYAVDLRLLGDDREQALADLLDAVASTFARAEQLHGTVTEAGQVVYLFSVNRAKGRRLAARLNARLNVQGDLTYLSETPDTDGLYQWVGA
jgi:hypothetical protein